MYSHIVVGANDVQTSKAFYDAVFGVAFTEARVFWTTNDGGMFAVTKPINGKPATFANGGTIGFAATSPEQVNAWHAAGVAAGGVSCEDPPGVRDMGAAGKLYLAYLRDPAGNKLCALHRLPA
jgi:catechol 2,3-dioxygenase-like lactoylglutathione lyase family enzyme